MNPFDLTNKTILITGASSGIGAQTAISTAKMGASIVLTGRNKDKLEEVYSKLEGENHQIIIADLRKRDEVLVLVDEVPFLDGVVHSSGIVKPFPIKFIDDKHLKEMFEINYNAPVLLMSKLFKAQKIKKAASIVFMSSISSHFSHKGGALYSSTKAALNSYSKTTALEFSHRKIRSNVISAAMVKTPLFDEAQKAASKENMDKHGADYPLGFGDPIDVANAIVYLLSDASKWVTGTEIVLDGGLTAGK
jgi:NAD(P)-dependent dehydrogenase (short-subunit alcohol dehydrogenase family)